MKLQTTKVCALSKGWRQDTAEAAAPVKYADGFLLFALTPSLSELTSQYTSYTPVASLSQKHQFAGSKDHPVASAVTVFTLS